MAINNLEADSEDEVSDDDSDEIEDAISDIENECATVFENKDNAKLLNEIFELGRVNYQKDRKGWEDFFADLKFELISTDDEDNIREILAHYLRKAQLELT
jgi:5'-3' exonuclease